MDTASLEPKFRKPAPYDRANIFSKVIFGYTAPTLLRGWRQGGLQVDDLYQSSKNDVVTKVARPLLLNWEREQTKCSKAGNKTKKPSFSWALFSSFLLCYLPPLTIYLITECIFRTAQPLLLGRVIRYFGGGSDDGSKKISYLEACLTAGGLCLMLFTQQTVNHPTMLHLKRLGMRLRVACCALLYQKSLRLSRGALGQTSVAQTVNIMSNDCNRFDEFSIWVPYVVIAPAHTLLSLYFVYQYVGVASLAGIAFLVAFLPYQSAMARLFSTVRFAIASLTDARLQYLSEIISGIRVIKMYAWERSFAVRIAKTRAKEVAQVAKACYLQAVNSSTYFIASKLVLFIILLMYVLLSGNRLNAEAVFACMSLLNAVQVSMTKYFPKAIGLGAEVRITCKRIEKFLLLEETTSDWESSLKKEKTSAKQNCYKLPKPKSPIVNEPSLTIEHITARWNADPQSQQTLSDISVDRLVSGDLLAVVGSVGSGKSSLLMTLLKELPLQSGTISVEGSLAYASQEAWSFNDSIRNNILFGAPYEPERYRRVIEVCALKRDLQLLPHSDQTLVGEKGVQLSGGQKARVNLARAVYRDADILLLDDPLSAVDATVAEHIFEQCIVGYLANKIRILVTHQLQFVEKATKILVLKEGSILAYGTWTELQQQGVDFMSILEKENEKAKKKEKENSENDTKSLHSDTSSLSSSTSSVYSTFQSITDSVKRKGSSSSSSITSSNLSSSQLSLNLLNQEVVKVKEELAQVGSLDAAVYGKYIRASGAPLLWITMITFTLLSQSLFHGTDIFLTYWTTKNQEEEKVPESGNNTTKLFDDIDEQQRDIFIYSGLIVALFASTIVRSFSFFAICNRASVRLHNDTFARLLRAPVAFYDSVPAGRILNRLAKDLGITDETLPLTAFDLNLILGNAIGVIVTVSLVNWYLVLPAVAIFAIVVFLRAMYIVSARDIKRIEGLTRSPIYNHVNITISGLASIRAYGAQEAFERQFHRYLDDHSGIWYHYLSFSKFIGIIIDWIVVLYIASITLSVMLTPELAGGYAGLAISSGLLLSGITQFGVRQSTEFETQMVSVERILDYQVLEVEAPEETSSEVVKLPSDWPSEGRIEFDRLSLEYVPGEPVLKTVSFQVTGGSKVGVVGRTGAGKSSLVAALFRLTEPIGGQIRLDGIETTKVGLTDLRKRISIIPQDPVIFSGSVRYNLDPFDEFTDDQLWAALEEVQLKKTVTGYKAGLEEALSDGGGNLSCGERQLLCLARALLRQNKVLVLDEATAAVDHETDALIQRTIRRSQFANCTLITIAHRLNTIIDCDRVLVLDGGEVLEYDVPLKLLDQKGAFYQMCKKTGPSMYAHLYAAAKKASSGKQ